MIDRFTRGVVLSVAGVLHALPAFAADDAGHGGTAHGAAHETPSLFSVDPGLMIWTAVTFLVVLIVLRFTAWGPLMQSLAERQKSIEGAIEEAQRTKNEAEGLLAKYETMLHSAKDEARSILDEARRDGIAVQEEIRTKAQQEAEEFKSRAHREIELAKNGALQEIWGEAANLSTELANRILGRTLGGSDQERLVKELIDDMRGELSGPGGGSGKA